MRPRSVLRARTGAALAGAAIALAGAAVVAHSAMRVDTMPSPSARAAGSEARADTPESGPSDQPVGPDATGSAAFGLCNAWSNHLKHDDGTQRAKGSVAMRNLAAAAGGEDKVEAYCASVPHPSERAKAGGDKDEKQDGKAGRSGKDKVEKEDGKAGRSGKDKPAPVPSRGPGRSSS